MRVKLRRSYALESFNFETIFWQFPVRSESFLTNSSEVATVAYRVESPDNPRPDGR